MGEKNKKIEKKKVGVKKKIIKKFEKKVWVWVWVWCGCGVGVVWVWGVFTSEIFWCLKLSSFFFLNVFNYQGKRF